MPKCPKCNYTLVLLEKRMKYKCAKCGRLFRQKEIDTKEFAEWNKNERAKEKKAVKDEINRANWKRYRKANKEKVNAWQREYNKRDYVKARMRKYYDKTREHRNAWQRVWYAKNKDRVLAQKKERHALLKDQINEKRRNISEQDKIIQNQNRNARRNANIDATRFNSRIGYWRQKQKALTVNYAENQVYRACIAQIHSRLPTSLLS
jgi:uncharacterized Zn finger protein (UPF0148 family)